MGLTKSKTEIEIPKTGLFMVIEGGDGSGKSTIVKYLAQKLEALGVQITLLREPGGTPFAEDVRDVFFKHANLSAETGMHIMNAQRQDNIEKIIIPALEKGHLVIADRFTPSTLVYQGILLDRFEQVNDSMITIPAANIFVDTPPDVALKRIRDNSRETNHFDEMDLDKHLKIYNGYKQLEQLNPNFLWNVVINGNQSITDVEKEVDSLVERTLVQMS